MKKLAIAASSVALAAMPVVGVFAADTDVRQSTDTLNVTVNETCNITSTYTLGTTGNAWGSETDDTAHTNPVYQTKKNTWTTNLANSDAKTSPVHKIGIFCNDTKGWDLSAQNAASLSTNYASPADQDTIAYSTSAGKGVEGYYVGVEISSGTETGTGAPTLNNVTDGKMSDLSTSGGVIFTKSGSTSTAGVDITYTVGTSATTEAGTYTGTVVYTLTPKS